jgi:hypothetical protein
MPSPHKKADWPIVAALLAVIVLAPLGLYVTGYFLLSTRTIDIGYDGAVVRWFDSRWATQVYYPAAKVEGVLIGNRVRVEVDLQIGAGT